MVIKAARSPSQADELQLNVKWASKSVSHHLISKPIVSLQSKRSEVQAGVQQWAQSKDRAPFALAFPITVSPPPPESSLCSICIQLIHWIIDIPWCQWGYWKFYPSNIWNSKHLGCGRLWNSCNRTIPRVSSLSELGGRISALSAKRGSAIVWVG